MKKAKVGFLTIGQSPRFDIISEIKPLLFPQIEISERGLLDKLTLDEIERLKPGASETPLVTRLRDGSQVELSEKKITSLLREVIDSMQKEMKIRAIGVLCTHEFPKKEFVLPVIFPIDYLKFIINNVIGVKKLGVVVPLESQVMMAKKKWKKALVETKSPYTEGKKWGEIAKKFIAEKTDAVILDCIGYKIKDRREVQKFIRVPILLPRITLAHAINQLF